MLRPERRQSAGNPHSADARHRHRFENRYRICGHKPSVDQSTASLFGSYLFINDDGAEIRDASSLWGKDTHETEDILKDLLGGKKVSVGAIGPVGENLGSGGAIFNDRNHNMCHSGVGSVMGSKNLKAIVTQGSKSIPVADPEKMKDIHKRWVQLFGWKSLS